MLGCVSLGTFFFIDNNIFKNIITELCATHGTESEFIKIRKT